MKEAYSFYKALPGDVVIMMCLFLGAGARLTRNESIRFWAAAKEFYWSLIVGAVLTGGVIWLLNWELLSAWWVALAAPMACSMVVEIAIKRANDIRDMNWKETLTFLFDEIQSRFKKTTNNP